MAQQDEHSEVLARIIQQYQELGRLLPEQQIQHAALASGMPKTVNALLNVGSAASAVGKGMLESAKAMHDGTKGLKAFDGAIDGAAKGLMILSGAVAALIPGLGLLMAGVIGAVATYAKLTKMANQQSDQLYDAFQQMSRSGGAAADGLSGLYRDVQRLGGGIQDLDEFVSLISANAGEFASFAGSVYQGRREFAKLSKEMEPFRASLMNAGMTQKEINQATAGYIRLQSRIGLTQNRTTTELAESTKKYLLEQDALTKLTGMNRREQEQEREAVRNREVFAARTLALRNAGQEAAAAQLEKTYLLLSKDSKDVADGFADIVSGNLRTEASQRLMRTTNGEAMQIQEELSTGQITAAQAADRMAMALKRSLDMYAETQGVLGNFNTTFTDLGGAIRVVSRLMTGGYERQEQIIERNAKRQGIFGDAMDKELETQTSLRLQQVNSMQNMQDFIRHGIRPATKSAEFFGKVLEYVTSLLPGTGALKRQFEAEKKASQALTEREVELSKAMENVLAAQAAADEAQTPEDVEKTKRDLEIAKQEARRAVAERDAAKKRLERAEAGLPDDVPEPEPRSPEEVRARDTRRAADAAAERLRDAPPDISPAERQRLEREERAAAQARWQAAKEAENARRRERLERGRASAGAPAAAPAGAAPAPAGAAPAPAGAAPAPAGSAPAAAPAGSAPAAAPAAAPRAPTGAGEPVSPQPGRVGSPDQSNAAPVAPGRPNEVASSDAINTIAKIVDASTWRRMIVEGGDGKMYNRVGLPAWRHNNPGNLRPTGWTQSQPGYVGVGDAGVSGKFAVFNTLEAGRKAKEALLFGGRTVYAGLNLRDALYKYAPPQDNNPTSSYLAAVMRATGLPETALLKDFNQTQRDAMLAQIEKTEGFKEGKIYAAAKGGIVKENLGGTLVWAGEAGQDEAIIPLENGAVPVQMSGNQELIDAMKNVINEFKSAVQSMVNTVQRADTSGTDEATLKVLQQIERSNNDANGALSQLVRLAQN